MAIQYKLSLLDMERMNIIHRKILMNLYVTKNEINFFNSNLHFMKLDAETLFQMQEKQYNRWINQNYLN